MENNDEDYCREDYYQDAEDSAYLSHQQECSLEHSVEPDNL